MSENVESVPSPPNEIIPATNPFILDEQSGILAPAPTIEFKSEVIEFQVSEDDEELGLLADAADHQHQQQQQQQQQQQEETEASMKQFATKRSRRKAQQPRRLDSQGTSGGGQRTSNIDENAASSSHVGELAVSTQVQVKVGLKTRSGSKIPCNVCGRTFASRYMTSHMRVHKDVTAVNAPRRSKRQASRRAIRIEKEQEDEDDDAEEVEDDEEVVEEEEVIRSTASISGNTTRKSRGNGSSSKLYECYVCDRSFSKSAMPAHMRTHETAKKNVDAEEEEDEDEDDDDEEEEEEEEHIDDGVNSSVDDYQTDGKPVTRRKLKKFPCDICGKSFDRYYLLEHMHSHARRMSRSLAKPHKSAPTSKKKMAIKKTRQVKNDETDVENNKQGSSDNDKTGSSAGEIEDDNDDATESSPEAGDEGSKKLRKTSKRTRRQRPKFPCDVCGSLFNKYYMVIHLRSHTGEKPFTCSACDKQFVSANSLSSHTNNCHGEQRGKVQCDICGRLVSSKMSLRQHLRTHSEEKPYQCHVCGKSFKQCAQLSAHVKTHSDGMPYQCEACGHRYKSVTGLIRHREYHHLGIRKKYPCELCGKSFTRHSKLRDHLMWHRGTSPYVCKYCGKRLLSRKTLNTHLLIHEDLKPYKCNVCGKSFRQNCVLKRHLTVHTGIKPFRCDLCGKQFIHRVYLVKHTCDVQQDGNRTFLAL